MYLSIYIDYTVYLVTIGSSLREESEVNRERGGTEENGEPLTLFEQLMRGLEEDPNTTAHDAVRAPRLNLARLAHASKAFSVSLVGEGASDVRYIYIYIYVCMYVCVYIYIYICIGREVGR